MNFDGKVEGGRIGLAAAGLTIYGLTLDEYVAIVTIIYLVIQIIVLTPRVIECLKTFVHYIRGQ